MCCQMARLLRTADIQRAVPTDRNQSEEGPVESCYAAVAVLHHPLANDRLTVDQRHRQDVKR